MFSLIIDGETKESKYELIVFLEIGLEIVLHCLWLSVASGDGRDDNSIGWFCSYSRFGPTFIF